MRKRRNRSPRPADPSLQAGGRGGRDRRACPRSLRAPEDRGPALAAGRPADRGRGANQVQRPITARASRPRRQSVPRTVARRRARGLAVKRIWTPWVQRRPRLPRAAHGAHRDRHTHRVPGNLRCSAQQRIGLGGGSVRDARAEPRRAALRARAVRAPAAADPARCSPSWGASGFGRTTPSRRSLREPDIALLAGPDGWP